MIPRYCMEKARTCHVYGMDTDFMYKMEVSDMLPILRYVGIYFEVSMSILSSSFFFFFPSLAF